MSSAVQLLGIHSAVQSTVGEAVSWSGVGLHSGVQCTLTVKPAAAGHGHRFTRTDLPGRPSLMVHPEIAQEAMRCTRLVDGDCHVMTPEHLLAALGGLGIWNVEMEMHGPEVPILDGSSAPFAEALEKAGTVVQGGDVKALRLKRPVFVDEGKASILVRPADKLHISYVAAYEHPVVGTQILEFDPAAMDFAREIAPARTFGFMEEVQGLLDKGLIQGGSMDCALVVDKDGYTSPLRFENEVVRHKVLDLLGDLSILGRPLCGHVIAVRTSHALHGRLLRALQEEEA